MRRSQANSALRVTLWLLVIALAACRPAAQPGDYVLASVPDVTQVGPQTYMDWFKHHAVTDDTRRYVAAHEDALAAVTTTVSELAATIPGAEVMTRSDPSRSRPALKEPHKVEEKIYRMILESQEAWARQPRGEGNPGNLPLDIKPPAARQLILNADPRAPHAIRDIAGLRIVLPDRGQLHQMDKLLRQTYQERIIRYKDFMGSHYRGNGYRAIHMVVLEGERPVEIQIRTGRQQRWAKWEHSLIYKGPFKNDPEAIAYATAVADRLHQQDIDRCPPPCPLPDCPTRLRDAAGCYLDPMPPTP